MTLDSPELELLIICLHDPISEQQQGRVHELLSAGINTQNLHELAAQYSLEMVLYRGLLQFRSAELQPLLDQYEERLATNALLFEFLYPQQLADVITAFESVGIETLVLKGYVLGQVIYQQPVLRSYGDFDILVHEPKLEQAESCLQRLGYEPDESQHPRSWYYENPFHHIAPYVHAERLMVEVHRNLSYNHYKTDLRINLDAVWANAMPFVVNGVQTRILCPEHQLVYLCLHAVNIHLFVMGLRPLVDIYKILKHYENTLDWSRVIETAEDWRCTRQVYLVLRLITAVFDVSAPGLQQFHIDGFDPRFMQYSLQNVLGTTLHGWDMAQVLQERNPQHMAKLMRRRLFPPRAQLAEQYGVNPDDAKVWLYYPLWYAATLQRILMGVWNLVRRDEATVQLANQEATRRDLLRWIGTKLTD